MMIGAGAITTGAAAEAGIAITVGMVGRAETVWTTSR
jgi:hypothetical protein